MVMQRGRPLGSETRALEEQVLRLRREGVSFADINRRLGTKSASAIFTRAMKREFAGDDKRREETRKLEELRLDELTRAVSMAARSGDVQYIDRALKIMERRAKLMGLDFSDKLDEQRVKLEEARVQLVAVAFKAALDAIHVDARQRAVATSVLLSTLRSLSQEEQDVLVAIEA